ncbi:type VI secretion system protein ImpH [Paraburkholderia bannensis]|uniref:Type VI secretion system protein ImpH n=1 Tax=Paraburkholderia bannensis TaxID=765414 RepID=A0A7W9TZS8_9BURK|nr:MULTISPECIES: type VI secretion system baseplate subunit TssG [Paraburkholderia]MBB3259386.1 type VI secretion system protein ImpH [Paraburkholderia sp. WP4_3_2]MBB6104402.1 type VI secretion system protein ImpH [Paraburkholderia bannensis]
MRSRRYKLAPFVRALLAAAPQTNVFQLLRLLELQAPDKPGFGTLDTPEHEPVRFRPHARVGFPGSEIAGVAFDEEDEDTPPFVQTTFLGLYGVDAAMPPHLIDDIVLRKEGHEKVTAFLDIFNHRIVTLLYRAWLKHHYPVNFRAGGTDEISQYLLSLAGMGIGDPAGKSGLAPSRLLALVGLFMQRTRPAEGVAGVVAHLLDGAKVTVREFYPQWTPAGLQQGLTAGRRARRANGAALSGLGDGHVLGSRVLDRSQAILVTIRPLDTAQAHRLLPGEVLHEDLMRLVGLYLGNKSDAIFRMEIPASAAPTLALTGGAAPSVGHRPRLTWTALLTPAANQTVKINLGRYNSLNF